MIQIPHNLEIPYIKAPTHMKVGIQIMKME